MAIDEELAFKNPCRKLPKSVLAKIPARNKRERFLTREEEKRLFEIGLTGRREHLRSIVKLALSTGIRRGGLLALEKEHINLSEHTVFRVVEVRGVRKRFEIEPNHLLVIRNKGGKPYSLPLNSEAREVLEELLAEETESPYLFLNERTGQNIKDIKNGFRSACRKAGIRDFTFHDLRHTFATRLKEAGVDPVTRRDLLGHASTNMTDDYTHTATDAKQRAVDALSAPSEGTTHKFPTKEEQPSLLTAVSA